MTEEDEEPMTAGTVLDWFSLQEKVALVTGGAGKYGVQITTAVAEAGAKTYIASRNLDQLEEAAASHRSAGRDVWAAQLDLSREESIMSLRDELLEQEGRVDILINNSVLRPMRPMGDDHDDVAKFDLSMRVNATGLFAITRAIGDAMAERGKGSIINIGSIHGMVGPDRTIYRGTDMDGFVPDYFFHKGGMINFTRFVASYYGPYDVRCNCISPGGLRTQAHPERFLKQYSDRTFLGRMANDTDAMGAVVFLASEASAYITGINLPVDGGYTAK